MYENFPYTNMQNLNLDWFLDEFKKLTENGVVSKTDFNTLLGRILNNAKAIENINCYPQVLNESVIPSHLIRSYTYDMFVQDMNILCEEFPFIRKKIIGKSVLGLNLYVLEIGSKTATNHLFVTNALHGNESSASIALAQIEILCRNRVLDNIDVFTDILDNDTCLHVIPMANPDGTMLVNSGFSFFPNIPVDIKNNIISIMEEYIQNFAKNENDGSNWNAENRAELENYIKSLGGDPSVSYKAYKFREKDLHCWDSNAHGIDLHYNFYTPDMENACKLALVNANHDHPYNWLYGSYGKTPYSDENKIYLEYMESFNTPNSTLYYLNYHQKGPTNIWNYRLEGLQNNRSYDIGYAISKLNGAPYSPKVGKQSTPIGATAWFTRYFNDTPYNFACTIEVGYSHEKRRGDGWDDVNSPFVYSPVPDTQWDWIYKNEKLMLLYMLRYYTSGRDVYDRHQYLTEYNIKDTYTTERFAIPSMALISDIITKVGSTYNSLSDLGLDSNASLNDIINKLKFSSSAKIGVNTSLAVSNDLPFWGYTKIGNLVFTPVSKSTMNVKFYCANVPYIYEREYFSNGNSTEWVNITPISTDYRSLGLPSELTNISIKDIAAKVNTYQTLIIDINRTTNNILDIPSEIPQYCRITISGHRPNNRIEITNINNGDIYISHYSRTNQTLTKWYKITATPI